MKNSRDRRGQRSDRRRRRPSVILSASSRSLRNTNAWSPQIAALNHLQVAMDSLAVYNNIAPQQEKDSLEKSSTIPRATHATSVVKQEAPEDVEETTKFTLFPKVSSCALT